MYVVHGLGDQLPDLPVGGGDGVEGGGVKEEVESAQGPQAVRVGQRGRLAYRPGGAREWHRRNGRMEDINKLFNKQ